MKKKTINLGNLQRELEMCEKDLESYRKRNTSKLIIASLERKINELRAEIKGSR